MNEAMTVHDFIMAFDSLSMILLIDAFFGGFVGALGFHICCRLFRDEKP